MWSTTVTFAAGLTGNVECLRWLRENGCPWCQCLPFMLAAQIAEGKKLSIHGQVKGGGLACLRYMRDCECPWVNGVCRVLFDGCRGLHCTRCPEKIAFRELVRDALTEALGIPWDLIDLLLLFVCE